MYEIETIPVSAFAQNCRILFREKDAVVVDPGAEALKISRWLKEKGVSPSEIWLTHSHLDHCGAVADLLAQYPNMTLRAHPAEQQMRAAVAQIAAMYGFAPGDFKNCPEPHEQVRGGETLHFAGATFQVLFTPGHSPGHVSFYDPVTKLLLAGDTLFQGSIGRYDLPHSNGADLMRSLNEVIMALPDDVRVLPGHGPDTTIGVERQYNPYLRGAL
jgi:glyoxylase-like metal-dependent hydrolase (beta-lactamase superfamily II)